MLAVGMGLVIPTVISRGRVLCFYRREDAVAAISNGVFLARDGFGLGTYPLEAKVWAVPPAFVWWLIKPGDAQGRFWGVGMWWSGTSSVSNAPRREFRVLLWPLDVVSIGVGVALLWTGAWARSRARSGRCSACGYDLSGLGPGKSCPECGKRGVGEGAGGAG